MNKKELARFRKLIDAERDRVRRNIGMIEEEISDRTSNKASGNQGYSNHMADIGSDAMEQEQAFLHASQETEYMKQLEDALKRIDDGSYGQCEECSGTNPPETSRGVSRGAVVRGVQVQTGETPEELIRGVSSPNSHRRSPGPNFQTLLLDPWKNFDVIDGLLRITLVRNSGAAFGILQGGRVFLIAASVAASIFIIFLAERIAPEERAKRVFLGMILGGR